MPNWLTIVLVTVNLIVLFIVTYRAMIREDEILAYLKEDLGDAVVDNILLKIAEKQLEDDKEC